MNIFEKHEIFEMEVLDKLKSNLLLQPLVFGGGSMLRLCFELNRYSVDLDFWFIKEVDLSDYSTKFQQVLEDAYEFTDIQNKYYSLLFEIRTARYPRRLKIEIRKEVREFDFQESIAFSPFSTKQVLLRTHTPEQSMKNKIEALLDRHEIRDAYDIEFLLRRGISLPNLTGQQITLLLNRLDDFTERDYKVKLGSVLPGDLRNYYVTDKFSLFKEKLEKAL